MIFEEKTITLKDGSSCILCPALPNRAAELIDYLRTVSGETQFLLRYPDEVNFSLESEREMLEHRLNSPKGFMMNGIVNGEIAGNCSVSPRGTPRRIQHHCEFAIAIKKKFWRLGLGAAMMKYALELAEQMGYEQIGLCVVEGNKAAKALYEKTGFEVTGKNIRVFKYDDGSYRDEFMMLKILNKE